MKSIASMSIVALLIVCPAIAGSTSLHREPAGIPKIDGNYTYTWIERCVTGDGSTTVSNLTGLLSADYATGTGTLTGYSAFNSPPVLTPFSGSESYSNTKTTVTFGTTTYQAFYGKLAKGVATNLTLIAVVAGDGGATCADQAWLTR